MERGGLIKKTSLMQLFFKDEIYIELESLLVQRTLSGIIRVTVQSHYELAPRSAKSASEIIVLNLRYFLSGRFSSHDTTPPSSSSSHISPSQLIVPLEEPVPNLSPRLVSARQPISGYIVRLSKKFNIEKTWGIN